MNQKKRNQENYTISLYRDDDPDAVHSLTMNGVYDLCEIGLNGGHERDNRYPSSNI